MENLSGLKFSIFYRFSFCFSVTLDHEIWRKSTLNSVCLFSVDLSISKSSKQLCVCVVWFCKEFKKKILFQVRFIHYFYFGFFTSMGKKIHFLYTLARMICSFCQKKRKKKRKAKRNLSLFENTKCLDLNVYMCVCVCVGYRETKRRKKRKMLHWSTIININRIFFFVWKFFFCFFHVVCCCLWWWWWLSNREKKTHSKKDFFLYKIKIHVASKRWIIIPKSVGYIYFFHFEVKKSKNIVIVVLSSLVSLIIINDLSFQPFSQ